MGENIFKQNRQKINLPNIKAAHTAQYQENKKATQKMGRRTKQTFLQRKYTDG